MALQMFLMGAMLTLFYLGLSSWYPFYNLYLKDLGFSGTQVGLLAGAYQSMLFFVVPLWGILSDRKGNRMTLMMTISMSAILIFGFQYIHSYTLMFGYMFMLAAFHHPIGSLADSMVLSHVQRSNQGSWGQARLWGSLGWAIGSIVMGRYLLNHSTSSIFSVGAAVYIITFLLLLMIQPDQKISHEGHSFSFKELTRIFGEKRIFFFFIILLFYGTAIAPIYVFINLYFRDIGADNQLIGWAFAMQAVVELPFFYIGQKIVHRFGAPKVLLVVMFTAALRMFCYSLIGDPVLALVVGLAQGITLSIFWVVVVDFVHDLIPSQWRATAQSLIWAFHLGAGVTLGNILIGMLSDYISMRLVMLLGSVYTLLILFVTIIYFSRFKIPLKHSSLVNKMKDQSSFRDE